MNFKSPKTQEDLKGISPVSWDACIGNVLYDVYDLPGFMHTQGGRYGDNCYWACPRYKEPSVSNLIGFNGRACNWGVNIQETNYIKSKWGSTSCRSGLKCIITRNGKDFAQVNFGLDIPTAFCKAWTMIAEFQEHSIPLCHKNWEEWLKNRKVYYYGEPGIITNTHSEGCAQVMIIPDGIEHFSMPVWWTDWTEHDWIQEYGTGLYVDFLSESIGWHRED